MNDFIRLREKDWERLQTLIKKYRGRSRMTAEEVRELGALYRAVASDLAVARRDYAGQRVTIFLNQLLTQAHSLIYQEDVSDFRRIYHYFVYTIPQTFRKSSVFVFIAFMMFIVPGIIGYQLAATNPDIAGPLGLTHQQETLANQSVWTDIPVHARPYASTFIMTNNIQVAILAFAGGVVFGLFTLYILMMNGLIIGAVMGLSAHYGLGDELWEFVVAHGIVELSIIFVAGGAGLQIGWAMLNPGVYSRRDALSIAAKRSLTLIVIAIPFLIASGVIEGFISPTDLSFGVKLLVGVGSGIGLYSYLLFVGRGILPATD